MILDFISAVHIVVFFCRFVWVLSVFRSLARCDVIMWQVHTFYVGAALYVFVYCSWGRWTHFVDPQRFHCVVLEGTRPWCPCWSSLRSYQRSCEGLPLGLPVPCWPLGSEMGFFIPCIAMYFRCITTCIRCVFVYHVLYVAQACMCIVRSAPVLLLNICMFCQSEMPVRFWKRIELCIV